MRRSLALLTVLAAVLAGCSSDDGADDAATTTTAAADDADATTTTAAGDEATDDADADAPPAGATASKDDILAAMGETDGLVDEAGRTCIAEGMAGRLSAAGLQVLNEASITELEEDDREVARTTFNECVDLADYAGMMAGATGDDATQCVMAELTSRFEGFGDLLIALDEDSNALGQEIATKCTIGG